MANNPFPREGLTKAFEPFIRKEVERYCESYPNVPRQDMLGEALRLSLAAEASAFGAQLAALESTNGGHLRADFVTRGGERKSIFFSSTPSDFRSERNGIALVRRMLRR